MLLNARCAPGHARGYPRPRNRISLGDVHDNNARHLAHPRELAPGIPAGGRGQASLDLVVPRASRQVLSDDPEAYRLAYASRQIPPSLATGVRGQHGGHFLHGSRPEHLPGACVDAPMKFFAG